LSSPSDSQALHTARQPVSACASGSKVNLLHNSQLMILIYEHNLELLSQPRNHGPSLPGKYAFSLLSGFYVGISRGAKRERGLSLASVHSDTP